MLPQPRIATLLLSGAVLAACAAEPPTASLRVLVKLAQPSNDPEAIAGMVSRAAGVPARYLAASGAQWHALTLACDGARECEAALGRLRAERTAVEAVERDERKRIVTP